ncbi:MAG: DUF3857 domain-containing protein [Gammaproteobacteria bacterium]
MISLNTNRLFNLLSGLLLFSLFFLSFAAEARWVQKNDLNTWNLNTSVAFEVFKDGSFIQTWEASNIALKDAGKDSLISNTHLYNAATTKILSLEAWTLSDKGKKYTVAPKAIQDKPLASSQQGFDQTRQVLIAYPNVEVNSQVHLKIKEQVKPAVKKFFSTVQAFNFTEKADLKIQSELPLNLEVQDPDQYLDIKKSQKQGKFYIEAKLKRPVVLDVLEEKNAYYRGKEVPKIIISSAENWQALAKDLAPQYEKVLSEPLPALFAEILKEAQSKFPNDAAHSSVTERIDFITASLADRLTYMGDWTTVKGAYVPRTLSEIAKTRYGDCKDFATVTTALLRSLGLKAEVAIVVRNTDSPEISKLPTLSHFNHAILRVQDNGITYWVDPTNFISFSSGIFQDIANREALILTGPKLELDKIPEILPSRHLYKVRKDLNILPDDKTEELGFIELHGLASAPITGAGLKRSPDYIEYMILSYLANPSTVLKKDIPVPELKSRILAPHQTIGFHLTKYSPPLKTSAGDALLLNSEVTDVFVDKTLEKRVSDLLLGSPYSMINEYKITNIELVGDGLKSCSVDYPWFEGSRRLEIDPDGGVDFVEEKAYKSYFISNATLKSPEYKKFQDEVMACFRDFGLVYKIKN